MSNYTTTMTTFLTYFDPQTPAIEEALLVALRQGDMGYTHLTADNQRALAQFIISMLRESLVQRSAEPLAEALYGASGVSPNGATPLSAAAAVQSAHLLLSVLRRGVFAALQRYVISDPLTITQGLEHTTDLLAEAAVYETERRFEALQQAQNGVPTSHFLPLSAPPVGPESGGHAQQLRTFSALVENMPDGVGVTTLEGTLTFANAAFRAMLGYDDALIGMNLRDILAEGDETFADVNKELQERGAWQGALTYRRNDGSTFRGHASYCAVRDAEGQPHALAAIVRDLTESERSQVELYTTNERMERVFAATPLITIEWDRDGIIQRWNPSAERVFGWSAKEMLGRTITERITISTSQANVQSLVAALMVGKAANSRTRNTTKDGQPITCQWYHTILRDIDGEVSSVLSQAEDITEQLNSEQERSDLQDQVIAAQRAALRELSTPLVPIADDVVAMPLIGSIDSTRAQEVIETLLTGVADSQAKIAILDITGVPVVDTQVANALLQAAQAVKLLGAKVIITGIRPEVAQTLVSLGVDLSSITTRSTLQSGIAFALASHGVSLQAATHGVKSEVVGKYS
jgi:rsbT co-antagonist protein RsbR